MARTRPALAALCTVVCLLGSACGSATKPSRAEIVVSGSGRIGNLMMGRSDARAVIAFLGRPDADRQGSENGSERFRALGYGCRRAFSRSAWRITSHGPFCRTVYWINTRTGKLGDFYTTAPRYVTSSGVRIGTGTAAAERRLHQVLYAGCEEDLEDGSLTVAFQGGTLRRDKTAGSSGLRVFGAHVYALAMSDGRSDVGVFDCL